jgi:hypothetical protein
MALELAFAADAVRQPSAGGLAIPVAVTAAPEGS